VRRAAFTAAIGMGNSHPGVQPPSQLGVACEFAMPGSLGFSLAEYDLFITIVQVAQSDRGGMVDRAVLYSGALVKTMNWEHGNARSGATHGAGRALSRKRNRGRPASETEGEDREDHRRGFIDEDSSTRIHRRGFIDEDSSTPHEPIFGRGYGFRKGRYGSCSRWPSRARRSRTTIRAAPVRKRSVAARVQKSKGLFRNGSGSLVVRLMVCRAPLAAFS
jgi:hypothetical protein